VASFCNRRKTAPVFADHQAEQSASSAGSASVDARSTIEPHVNSHCKQNSLPNCPLRERVHCATHRLSAPKTERLIVYPASGSLYVPRILSQKKWITAKLLFA